jgi:DNA-binding CsgD family transcriptional regulator
MDDFQAAASLCAEAIEQAEGHDRIVAQTNALLSELSANGGDPAKAVAHAEQAVSFAESSGDLGLLAEMLAVSGMMALFNGEGAQLETMERAASLEEHAEGASSYSMPSTSLGSQLFWSDLLDEGRPLLERSLRRATERGEEFDRGALLFHLAHLEWEAGNVAVARSYTRDAIALAGQLVDDQADSYMLWLQAYVAARTGDLDRARSFADAAIEVAERIGDQFIVAFSNVILASVELWTGDPAAAHLRLPGIREALLGGGRGFVGSLTIPFWSCDIEALIAIERLDPAQSIQADFAERAAGAGNPNAIAVARRCGGLLMAARGDVHGAIEAMQLALTEHAVRPLPLEIGRTLVEKGTLERRARRKSAAKHSLEEAIGVLEPLEAGMWLSRARDELGRIGMRKAAAAEGLTPAQTRVAELAAAGMTNREIGAALYMSVRTVESHLTKIYGVVGVKSRAQLAAVLAAKMPTEQ